MTRSTAKKSFFEDRPGAAISALFLLLVVLYVVIDFFYYVPREEARLREVLAATTVSKQDLAVKEVLPGPTTKIKLDGLENAVFDFGFVKAMNVGQTFVLFESNYGQLPKTTLCEAQNVEKTQMSGGKTSRPVVVLNKMCYVVAVEGSSPLNYDKVYLSESPAKAPERKPAILSWLATYNK